jgi:26S proteasome regulatory subunit N2
MAVVCSSAQGLLAQFKHTNSHIKAFALEKLNDVVDYCWHEIANYLPEIQDLALNTDYQYHELAAYLASQVHYHLENYKEALMLALESGAKFDISLKSDFVQTLVSHCINQYISAEVQNYNARTSEDRIEISDKMKYVVEKMFERCFADGEFKQAIGISIEARRLDKLEESILKSGDSSLLKYTYEIVKDIVLPKEFRKDIVICLVKLHMSQTDLDFASVSEYKFFINDSEALAIMLEELISKDPLFAYQLCLDLVENQKQVFLNEVSGYLSRNPSTSPAKNNVLKILTGRVSIDLTLNFLQTKTNTDKQLIAKIKNSVDAKSSVTHGSLIFANAFMSAGTTDDSFLRDNLSWVAKATNWGKFSAVACLGVIHRGNLSKAMEILKPYLPSDTAASSGAQYYSEGGALYALGMIHSNFMQPDIVSYIDRVLSLNSNSEVIQHGGCLGLGLIAMGSGNKDIYDKFKAIVYNDKANSGEAAAYGIGIVMLGSANEQAINDILAYAHETQHEKIIRGLGIALAFIMYKREEEADALITQLLTDKDPILRYGGVYTIATSYIGTANTNIIKKLLHLAVSDVDYDVRKASVTAIGFVLCRLPEQVPKVVALLSESYNPYVRQGAAMAIGIACAGNPLPEALSILENLLIDNTNFVRQAAFVAMAMVLIQSNKVMCPKVEKFRERIEKVMTEKNQDILTKMGAIVSLGILDAGGRNVTISLDSSSGNNRAPSTVGIIMALQFWYWFPLLHMLSLSFKPTCLLGIDQSLSIVPSFTFTSKAKPSLYAYPPKIEAPSNEKSGKVSTAVLSTTNKVKARAAAKRGEKTMDLEENKQEASEEKKNEVKDEPSEEVLKNPSRVLNTQAKVIAFNQENRYVPVIHRTQGFIVLRDAKPEVKMQSFELETEVPEEFVFDPEVQKKGN